MAVKGVIDWVADHPYESAGVTVAGLVVILLLYRMASGGSSSAQVATDPNAVSPAVQAAEVQSATQLQLAQVAAGAQSNQVAAQVQVAGLSADVQKTIAAIEAATATANATTAAGVQNNSTTSQANVAIANINAQLAATQAELAAQTAQNNNASAVETDLISTLNPNSNSGVTNFVNQAYETYLGRAPDPLAQQWVQGLQSGAITQSQFLFDVRNSPEALNDLANGTATASLVTANNQGEVVYHNGS